MTLRNLAISLLAATFFCACGSGNTATAEEKPQAITEQTAESDGVISYDKNAAITPDEKLPVIIDFNATWCGPCQRFAPIFEETAKAYKGKAIFMSVDVDKSPLAAQQFEVSAIPQVSILMPDGTMTSTVGYMEKAQFIDFLKPLGL